MKTKPIIWDETIMYASCGGRHIGRVETYSGKYPFKGYSIFSVLPTENLATQEEARAWVEQQFTDFIERITA